MGDCGTKLEIMCGFIDHVEGRMDIVFSLVDKTRGWIRMKR